MEDSHRITGAGNQRLNHWAKQFAAARECYFNLVVTQQATKISGFDFLKTWMAPFRNHTDATDAADTPG